MRHHQKTDRLQATVAGQTEMLHGDVRLGAVGGDPARRRAVVMMSRLPAYGGRKSPAPSTSRNTATRMVSGPAASNCGSDSSRYPGTYVATSVIIRTTDSAIAAASADAGTAQNTVSRMIIG